MRLMIQIDEVYAQEEMLTRIVMATALEMQHLIAVMSAPVVIAATLPIAI